MQVVVAPSRDIALFHALRLQRALPEDALDEQLRSSLNAGVPFADALRACGLLPAGALERALEVVRRQARRCGACGEETYLTPGASITTRRCERCDGPLERSVATAATPGPETRPERTAPEPPPTEPAPEPAPPPAEGPAAPPVATVARTSRPPRPGVRRAWRLVARVLLGVAAVFAGKALSDHLHRRGRESGRATGPVAAEASAREDGRDPTVGCTVRLPSGASLDPDALVVCCGTEELAPVPAGGELRLPRRDRPVLVTVRLDGADYLRAWVTPEDDAFEVSTGSTAVALVLAASTSANLGDPAMLSRARAAALEEPAVQELAAFLDSSLSIDPRCLAQQRPFPGLRHKVLHAVQALDARLRP